MSELIIHGLRPTENFTIIPNEITQNRLLSFEAVGFVTYLLGVPEFKLDGNPWETSIQRLCKLFPDSTQYKISKILDELKSKNFLSIERVRDDSNRRITKCRWSLFLDRITGRSSLQHDNRDIEVSVMNNQTHNKTDTNKTEFNKTNSAPENPLPEISEPISLDLEQSVIPEPVAPKTANALVNRVDYLKTTLTTSPGYQAALKKREQADAAFQAMLLKGQNAQQQATQALTAAYVHLTPAQTVEALCREHIANPKPRLDAPNRAKLTSWLQNGGGLLPLIEAFKQAQRAQSKTAKYVVKILATWALDIVWVVVLSWASPLAACYRLHFHS